jgi:ABC-2 type transport system permease protein
MAAITTTPSSAPTGGVITQQERLRMMTRAFFAILQRDMLVTWREFIPFLIQVLIQPLFFLFIFGKVLTSIGFTSGGFSALLLPGIVGLTIVVTALQGVTLPLVLDLGFAREIDDRLLAPLPVSLVATEKVLFAAIRGLIGGTVIFPLAWWILGSGFAVRTDSIPGIIGLMILTSLAGACLGLTIGTLVKPEQIGLMFSLIFTPLIFTGCTYYPWSQLGGIKWFQILTLFNPMTYASEGLRATMTPPIHFGPVVRTIPTLGMGWIVLALVGTIVVFFAIGQRTFRARVVN